MDRDSIDRLGAELAAAADAAADTAALEAVRVAALGKKGRVTELMKGLGAMAPEARRAAGQSLNQLRDRIEAAIAARAEAIRRRDRTAKLAEEKVDVTLPVRPTAEGKLHPVSQVIDEVTEIFAAMGFVVAEGPDIEDDFHNFTALNIPPEHPARQMHDTFYLAGGAGSNAPPLLRTHTSPVQVRTMQAGPPPYRIVVPGRTYRRDSDQTHTPMFHQIEGLAIDRSITMGHLKGCLEEFARAFFESDQVRMRFRPSHFPFTEPSAEVDINYTVENGVVRVGAGERWMEILGCGMVHPKVLEMCGVDPAQWQGFAFGMGLDRIAMLKYGIPDLRTMFEGDLRWLAHYGFSPLDLPSFGQGLSR
ncbi:MAG: phenylalanine--tRNA ligase subunit alpha [Alphaproteobacteria bacterium]|nr:phenylalanine--tRNA ligase subunit alpha [Alphaproteobacteria bacterium]